MSDCSPLRLADNGHSSPSQSSGGSQNSQVLPDNDVHIHQPRRPNEERRRLHHNRHQARSGHSARDNDVLEDNQRLERTRSPSESTSKSGHLRYGARNVIELFIPVSLCMLIVVATMKATDSYKYSSQTVIWYAQVMFTDQSVDTGTRVWQSFANAFIMLILIAIMTTVLILLYKFRCYATIHGWLILSSLILLFMFAGMYIAEILKVYNIPIDNYTVSLFIWNFGVVGMICIHWKGPLLLQQAYLITISALLALVFIRSLPDWTTWTVLAIVSIWDLVAVLCPRGPLRILVETAQERNEAIFPALIYSSTMVWIVSTVIVSTTPTTIGMADRPSSSRGSSSGNRSERTNRNNRQHQQQSSSSSSSNNEPSRRRAGKRSASNNFGGGSSPSKRSQQHPVEIHYEEGAQPPMVDIIQPTLSGSSDNWPTPDVRAVPSRRERPIDNNTPRERINTHITPDGVTSTEVTINYHPSDQNASMEEERGVKLGLGDFIFYSLLVGKASSYGDWTITLSCYVAILVGLCLTLSLLAVFRKALPALPISIAFGMCSFFMSYTFAVPLAEDLAINQIFI